VLRLRVDQNRMALVERATLGVLSREAHGFPSRSTEPNAAFRRSRNRRHACAPHFRALFEKFHNFRVDVKPFGHANEAVGDFRKFLGVRPVSTS